MSPTSLRHALYAACIAGGALLLLVPACRGYHPWLGWMPLWLLAMPLAATAMLCWARPVPVPGPRMTFGAGTA